MRCFAALLLALLAGAAQAATYNYRADSFAWETAANAVTWDRTCTAYPGDDDKATVNFTGGFTFRFAGTDHSSVRILSNGMLQFGADSGFHRNYTNSNLPAGSASARSGCVAGATVNTLMAYWTDLNPSQAGSGNVTWELKGTAPDRRFVVSWNNVFQYNTSTPYAVQVVLYENGEFKYQYGNDNASGSRATIGVQVNSSDFTLYAFNSGYNANGTAIRWSLTDSTPVRLAEYRFDEYAYTGRVGEVRDSSASGFHGVRVGAGASHANGAVCRALEIPFNNSATISGVDTQVNASASMGARGSFSFWWRYNQAWTGSNAAMLLDASGSVGLPIFLQRDAGGVLRLRVSSGDAVVLTATSPAQTFAAGTWVHIAGSWRLAAGANQSVLRLFVNGALVGSTSGTTNGQLAGNAGSLVAGDARLGSAPSGGTANSADGRIDELRLYNYDIGLAEVVQDRDQTHPCTPPLDHVRIEHSSGAGVTCTPSTLTLRACTDADCLVPFLNGLSGTLSGSGGVAPTWPDGANFTIPAGQSTVSARVQLTTAGSSLLAATVPGASQPHRCNFGAPSCTYSAADAGFLLRLPNHRAETAATLEIEAVRKSDNALACAPAFGSVSRSVSLACRYLAPAGGSQAVRVAGQALNASGSAVAACGTRALPVTFDANGRASLSLLYADAGRISVDASYSGSVSDGNAGLSLSGSVSAVVAPQDFDWTDLSSGAQRAGMPFAALLRARNAAGAVTPNFGLEGETVQLSHLRRSPTGAGAVDGSLSVGASTLSAGTLRYTELRWSEVGRIDLSASLVGASYLGSGMNVQGITGVAGAIGPFRPHHLRVRATEACGTYSYAGQPFDVTVSARNASEAVTLNYFSAGGHARDLAFTDAGAPALGLGGISPATLAASAFSAGEASTQLAYAFTSKASGPGSLLLRATDSDGVSSSQQANADDSMLLRSGRLQLQSAIGSAQRNLSLPLRLEHWRNGAWVLTSDDSCTLPHAGWQAAVAQSGRVGSGGAAAAWSSPVQSINLTAGVGSLVLAAPNASGTVDVALNLGNTTTDRACLAGPRPAASGLNVPWLRSRQGSLHGCGAREDSDPSGRASFGAPAGQANKVHERVID
ncbi:DUF6701 domain-containing protein [Inhella sp.]|uniref:DUF6701 domain-containing protein n=1 Tax=Inhella sp. TaxID=1921806 RepID=UPI0035B0E050